MDFVSELAVARYEKIGEIVGKCVERVEKPKTFSDIIDTVVTDKYVGIPIFLALMWAVFQFAYSVSAPFSDAIDVFFSWCGDIASGIENSYVASFLSDGFFGGWGFVLVFLPPIAFVFIALTILEQTGYLPRAAFVVDRAMTKVGLQGKSFIPMLLGFGCNIPAIMATRTMEDDVDRKITIMVNPLMSCSARLPVYVLFAGVFFKEVAGAVVTSMYLLGILLAAIMATLFRKFIFGGKPSPLLMELPPYETPTLRSVLMNAWGKTLIFLKKAATILFIGAIIMWFLTTHPWDATNGGELIENSYASMIGHAVEPIVKPFGLDWTAGVALVGGFMAKEIVVGTLGMIYGVGEEGVADVIPQHFTPASALALMAITLIYVPCLATIGILRQELGSWKWTAFVVAYELVLAYVVAGIIYGIAVGLGVA
ncbi:MAG: ferrous iron transport protein B [Archaeoglobaceae archaeon]|nr:ferrous iron transport protein B [Archaeoglobaceae archaeon]